MATFTLSKTGCHTWKLSTDDAMTTAYIKLYTYMDVLLNDELVFNSSNECSIDLDIYDGGGDGAYYIQLTSTDIRPVYTYLCIYDFCDAENCYKALFKYVLCKCTDPCDEDCIEKYQLEQKRLDLELIFALYTDIERNVYNERYKYYGITSINDSRRTLMSQIGRAITKLSVVVDRCGMCSDEVVEDLTC
jgi:hypothetical protein